MNTLNNYAQAEASPSETLAFYKKTYAHVAGGVLVFVLLEALLLSSPMVVNFMFSMTEGYLWLLLIGGFMGINWVAQKMAYESMDRKIQYLGYFIYILGQALIFVPLIGIALLSGNPAVLQQAGIVTLALFAGLSATVFFTSTDFSILRGILVIGSFLALGLIVAGLLFGFDLGLWFSVGMCVLASASILYNTYQIKNNFHTDQYVAAALSLFSSLMLLFWYILRIFLSRD